MDLDQDSVSPSPASSRGDATHDGPTASTPVPEAIDAALPSPTEEAAAAAHSHPAGSVASGRAAEPAQSGGPASDGVSKGRPVAPRDAHVVVIQPDNEVNVGVNVDKCVPCMPPRNVRAYIPVKFWLRAHVQ